ncbi:serine hydrolase [Glaciihabitans sp. UYNi722]|uniref:serine hydrolase domain-containing protein n=1 Tax=Glaciihabitans sp. UYNi722 TaxID=3156344 RepID=UPI0033937239
MRLPRATVRDSELAVSLEALALDCDDASFGVDSVMVVRGGEVVLERYWHGWAPRMPHEMYSVTKTFTATAVGIAADEGLIDVDSPLRQFFGREGDGIDERITLRHLLTMTSGRTASDSEMRFRSRDQAVAAYAELEQVRAPGTAFSYCSLTSHILSLALRVRTGKTLFDFLEPRLLSPLGISAPAWQSDLDGNQVGGSGLFLTTEDLACCGLLFLQRGSFAGRRIFSESWHASATSPQIDTAIPGEDRSEWMQGYGYQMWRGLNSTYRADGMLGQFAIVAPDHDSVIAVTARSHNTDRILAAVADRLLT